MAGEIELPSAVFGRELSGQGWAHLRAASPATYADSLFPEAQTGLILGKVVQGHDWTVPFFPKVFPALVQTTGGFANVLRYAYHQYLTDMEIRVDTRLPEHAPYTVVGMDFKELFGELTNYGAAAAMSMEQLAIYGARLPVHVQNVMRAPAVVVSVDYQYEVATAITTDANFGTVVTLAGGSEWGAASTNLLGNIETACDALNVSTGIRQWACTVIMTKTSWRAARKDTAYKAYLTAAQQGGRSVVTASPLRADPIMAEYLGVAEVLVIQPLSGLSLLDRTWVLAQPFTPPETMLENGDYGRTQWGALFAPHEGVYLKQFTDDMHRREVTPFVQPRALKVLQAAAGYMIKNCAP
jgi:hypothetical protein